MTTYKSRRAEMLEKLFVEERDSAEYKRAFNEASREASYFDAVASLPKLEKLRAIESAVYKKLFGDASSNETKSCSEHVDEDDAEAEPKEVEVTDHKIDKSVKNTTEKPLHLDTDVDTTKNIPAGTESTQSSSLLQPKMSYRDQAAKPAPPPEVTEETIREARRQELARQLREKMGPQAWNRNRLQYAKDTAALDERLARLKYETKLIPRKPGGKIHQYTTFAPATWDCKNLWTAQAGAHMRHAQKTLNVHFESVFERDVEFRLWVQPTDWKAFENNPEKGKEILARGEKFVEFWVWDFMATAHVTDLVPLTTCLDWFLKGDTSPRYQEYLKIPVTPKSATAIEARQLFHEHAAKGWEDMSAEIEAQD